MIMKLKKWIALLIYYWLIAFSIDSKQNFLMVADWQLGFFFYFYWLLLCSRSCNIAQQIKECKFKNFVEWIKKTKLVERSAIYSIFWLLSNLQRKEIFRCFYTLINSPFPQTNKKNMWAEDSSIQKNTRKWLMGFSTSRKVLQYI